MFIPFIKNLLFSLGYCFPDFTHIAGLYVITFTFYEYTGLLIPIKCCISIRALNMDVNRLVFLAPKEKTKSV